MFTAVAAIRDQPTSSARLRRVRFKMLDATLLVAAVAVGCGAMMAIARAGKGTPYQWYAELIKPEDWHEVYDICGKPYLVALLTMPVFMAISLALLPISLIGAQTRLRRLARQPGFVACCASGVTSAVVVLPVVVGALCANVGWDGIWTMVLDLPSFLYATTSGGLAIIAAWTTLLVGGRWRAQPNWTDRLGRALGLYWILLAFALCIGSLMSSLLMGHGFPALPAPSPLRTVGLRIVNIVVTWTALVAVVTLMLIPIRIFGSWQGLPRLTRRPGFIACCASTAAVVLAVGLPVIVRLVYAKMAGLDFELDGDPWEDLVGLVSAQELMAYPAECAGLAVAVGWMTLLVGKQWRAERGWVDRAGRAVGVCWILAALAVAFAGGLIQADTLLRSKNQPATTLPSASAD